MRCEELMTSEVELLDVRATVRDAARRMRDLNIGFLPIVDDGGQLVGVLTDRDIAVRVVAENHGPARRGRPGDDRRCDHLRSRRTTSSGPRR